jgi:hypothetical protein
MEMKYVRVPMPLGAPGCHGVIHFDILRIEYADPLGLAHEVAHAIEVKMTGKTTEYGAWRLAYSFIKPKYWNQKAAQESYNTYVSWKEHKVIFHYKMGSYSRHQSRCSKMPTLLEFDGKHVRELNRLTEGDLSEEQAD